MATPDSSPRVSRLQLNIVIKTNEESILCDIYILHGANFVITMCSFGLGET